MMMMTMISRKEYTPSPHSVPPLYFHFTSKICISQFVYSMMMNHQQLSHMFPERAMLSHIRKEFHRHCVIKIMSACLSVRYNVAT